jgi:hypothetical protein
MFPQKFTGGPSADEFWRPYLRLRYCGRRKRQQQGRAKASRRMEMRQNPGGSFEQPLMQNLP